MPRFDGTGPRGKGPMTGRGLGPCGKGLRERKAKIGGSKFVFEESNLEAPKSKPIKFSKR